MPLHLVDPGTTILNQYNIGRRGCALMLSLLKANWDRRAGGQAQVSKGIGMHAQPKITEDVGKKVGPSGLRALSWN